MKLSVKIKTNFKSDIVNQNINVNISKSVIENVNESVAENDYGVSSLNENESRFVILPNIIQNTCIDLLFVSRELIIIESPYLYTWANNKPEGTIQINKCFVFQCHSKLSNGEIPSFYKISIKIPIEKTVQTI